jgi:nitrogen fixation protein FixH
MSTEADTPKQGRELTGKKVLAIFVAMFGIIIGVNVFMAYNAISTFPGMEVSSSYADSQTFDVRRDAQEALGWDASVGIEGDTLVLTLVDDANGRPVYPAELDALADAPDEPDRGSDAGADARSRTGRLLPRRSRSAKGAGACG